MGIVRYLADGTRPEIDFIVSFLARFQQAPTKQLWSALKKAARYLKGTPTHGIFYPAGTREQPTVDTHADADFASETETRRSISGNIHFYNNAPIAWSSRRQITEVLSTTEAEYISYSGAARHAQYLRSLLAELGHSIREPTLVHADNQGAIKNRKRERPPHAAANTLTPASTSSGTSFKTNQSPCLTHHRRK